MNTPIKQNLNSNKGFTLVEVLISLMLISIIVTAFMSLFVYSAKTNEMSKTSTKSTYIARDTIEMIYDLSKEKSSLEEINNALIDKEDEVYKKLTESGSEYYPYAFYNNKDNKYITVELEESGESQNLIRVIVKVYEEKDGKIEAQMETLLRKGQGVVSD